MDGFSSVSSAGSGNRTEPISSAASLAFRGVRRELPRLQSAGAGLLLRYFFGPEDPVIAPGGKPYYPGGRVFSLTHSGTLAAIALSLVVGCVKMGEKLRAKEIVSLAFCAVAIACQYLNLI